MEYRIKRERFNTDESGKTTRITTVRRETSGGDGCGYLIGSIIVAAAIGTIFREAYGWLTFGGLMILAVLLEWAESIWRRKD